MFLGKPKLISKVGLELFSSVKVKNGRPPVLPPFNPKDHGLS